MTTLQLIKKLVVLLGIFLSATGSLTQNNIIFLIGIILSIGGSILLFKSK